LATRRRQTLSGLRGRLHEATSLHNRRIRLRQIPSYARPTRRPRRGGRRHIRDHGRHREAHHRTIGATSGTPQLLAGSGLRRLPLPQKIPEPATGRSTATARQTTIPEKVLARRRVLQPPRDRTQPPSSPKHTEAGTPKRRNPNRRHEPHRPRRGPKPLHNHPQGLGGTGHGNIRREPRSPHMHRRQRHHHTRGHEAGLRQTQRPPLPRRPPTSPPQDIRRRKKRGNRRSNRLQLPEHPRRRPQEGRRLQPNSRGTQPRLDAHKPSDRTPPLPHHRPRRTPDQGHIPHRRPQTRRTHSVMGEYNPIRRKGRHDAHTDYTPHPSIARMPSNAYATSDSTRHASEAAHTSLKPSKHGAAPVIEALLHVNARLLQTMDKSSNPYSPETSRPLAKRHTPNALARCHRTSVLNQSKAYLY